MEMSSPANRNNLDDDIDIDFDDYQGGVQVNDDEQMVEDGDATRPTTATDDMMDDDMLPDEQVQADEEVMQDDEQVEEQAQEDEELIDYGDDEFQDQPIEDTTLLAEQPTDTGPSLDDVDEEITRAPETAEDEIQNQPYVEGTVTETEQVFVPPVNFEDDLAPATATDGNVAFEAGDQDLAELLSDDVTKQAQYEAEADPDADEEDVPPAISVNTAVSAPVDTPGTPTDTGLHPMSIRYGDLHMALFKSKKQPDGLLKDDNLASLSLAELIKNCRQRLALKIGEDISQDQELVLGFDSMGLMLVEVSFISTDMHWTLLTVVQDSRSAFESSLNDVLEVYLQLHQNDGMADIPPLSLNLSLQLKFASSFSILKQAAAGGQGMSNFGFLQPVGHEEFYQEDYGEDGDFLGQQGDAAPEEEYEDDHGETAHDDQYDDTGQQYEDHGPEQPSDAYHEDGQDDFYQQYEDYEHTVDQEYTEGHEGLAGFEEIQDEVNQSIDPEHGAVEDQTAVEQDTTGEDQTTQSLAAPGPTEKVESTASSTTIQGDGLNDSFGEYDDLIDWDDDSLTCGSSEPAVDGHEDFSTFLTEYEDEGEHATLSKQGPNGTYEQSGQDSEQQAAYLAEPGPDHQDEDAQNLGSENFLNDFDEQQYDDEQYHAGQEGEQEAQDDYDHADTYDEQQEDELNPDYQPGDEEEDDENFHTAHDLLDGEGYEHGLEHDPNDEGQFDDSFNHENDGEHQQDEYQEDFEDQLDFDETTEVPDGDQIVQSGDTGSPLGKRSFGEIDDFEGDEPDAKKAKAS